MLSPVARPITPESLKDKRLAVDASIWLYQFQMAIRDRKTGEALKGNHIREQHGLLSHISTPVRFFLPLLCSSRRRVRPSG